MRGSWRQKADTDEVQVKALKRQMEDMEAAEAARTAGGDEDREAGGQ